MRVCPHPLSRLWGRAAPDVFLQDTRIFKKLIGLPLVQKILRWRHTGFNVHSKVYEVDPMICPSCGGQMSIISFIEEPKIIDRIIAHLELTFEAERPPPPQIIQHVILGTAEEREEYF